MPARIGARRGLRAGLACTEFLVGVAALFGGVQMIRDGFGMPVRWLEGTPFHSWVLPGIALMAVVGLPMIAAAAAVGAGRPHARVASVAVGVVLLAWIGVQVVVLGRFHILQPILAVIGGAIVWLSLRLPDATPVGTHPGRQRFRRSRHASGSPVGS